MQPAGSGGSEKCSGRGPVAYHERVFPSRISGVRADMVNQWNPNMAKNLHIIERLNMQLRLDALNVQNQSQMGGPTTDPPRPCLGKITSQTDSRQPLAAGAGAHHVLKSGGQKHP